MTQLYAPLLKEFNLTYPQFLVMLVLWEQGKLTVTQIGEELHLDSGTLSPLLTKLVKQGYVIRKKSANDQRSVIIALTPAGVRLERKTAQVPQRLTQYLDMRREQSREYKEKTQNFVNVLLKAANDFKTAVESPKYKRK